MTDVSEHAGLIIDTLRRVAAQSMGGRDGLPEHPALWWIAGLGLLLAAILLAVGSGKWSARIARDRNHPAWRHFAAGLVLPLAYPILLLLVLRPKGGDSDDDIGSPVRPRAEYIQPASKPRKVVFPEHLKRRSIGRAIDEDRTFADDDSTRETGDFQAYRAYFERLMQRARKPRRRQTSYRISYDGDAVVADSIVEVLPTAVVVEHQRPDDATVHCIRIPYAKITRCQVGRFRP